MKLTQHQKIIEMCSKGDFFCQIKFWDLFIRSPHKRRAEIEERGIYKFINRKCEHGIKNGRDYMMIKLPSMASVLAFAPKEKQQARLL